MGTMSGPFSASAAGSVGDAPPLRVVSGNGTISFQGTGGGISETYQVQVKYGGTVLYSGKVAWSVDGCEFALSIEFAAIVDGG
jgi:autotransporter translocation and assembly factor TamB